MSNFNKSDKSNKNINCERNNVRRTKDWDKDIYNTSQNRYKSEKGEDELDKKNSGHLGYSAYSRNSRNSSNKTSRRKNSAYRGKSMLTGLLLFMITALLICLALLISSRLSRKVKLDENNPVNEVSEKTNFIITESTTISKSNTIEELKVKDPYDIKYKEVPKDEVKYNMALILINDSHRMEAELTTESFGQVNQRYNPEGFLVNKEAIEAYNTWAKAVENETSQPLIISSAYRNFATQKWIFENDPDAKLGYVQKPGASEHHTGFAIDIADMIDNAKMMDYLSKMSYKYGFILRYPKGKEDITGIQHEDWHFRYVGTPHSEIIKEHDFVLEEYIAYLRNNSIRYEKDGKKYLVYSVKADEKMIKLPEDLKYSLYKTGTDIDIVLTEIKEE